MTVCSAADADIDLTGRLSQIRHALPTPAIGSISPAAVAPAGASSVDISWETGLIRWFRHTKRILDWSFFARPGGSFVQPCDCGNHTLIVPQRTLYYLQVMGALTASPGDITLVSSSAMALQDDLPLLWAEAGVLSPASLASSYVVDDLRSCDPSLAGDTALSIGYALRHGQPVPVTPAVRWRAGRRDELTHDQFLALIGERVYTSPLRGVAHDELERFGIRMSARHAITDRFERSALYPASSLSVAACQMLPTGYLTWSADEAVRAARELLRHTARVYMKADGIGGAAVVVAESSPDAAVRIRELQQRARVNATVGTGRAVPTGERFPSPVEVAADAVIGERPLWHFTVQIRIAGSDADPRVEILNASAKEPGVAYGSRPLDSGGREVLRRLAPELAEVALAARPPKCELLSLEGFVLSGNEHRIRLIEANLRLAGMSQIFLAYRAVVSGTGLSSAADYLVGNVPVAPRETNRDVLLRLRHVAAADNREVMILGRETPGTAKILTFPAA